MLIFVLILTTVYKHCIKIKWHTNVLISKSLDLSKRTVRSRPPTKDRAVSQASYKQNKLKVWVGKKVLTNIFQDLVETILPFNSNSTIL